MYGSMQQGEPSADYHALPPTNETSFQRTLDRRKEFAKRRQHDSTKRRLKELQTERPVFGTLFDQSSATKTTRSRSREIQLETFTTAAFPAGGGGTRDIDPSVTSTAVTTPVAHKGKKQAHSFLYSMLSPHSKRRQAIAFKHFITLVIIVDLVLFILSTDETFTKLSDQFYRTAEGIASCIFLLEYLGRLWTITEKHKYGEMGPIVGRLAYARTFSAVIDLIAALPFFLEIPTGWNLPTLTYLRFIRLFRILKTEDYVKSLDAVYRVIYFNRQILYVATLVCILLVLVTSILLYYCRPQGDLANPQFDSLGDTMYMSTLMLTGGGGPDTDNLPWYTKSVVLLTSVFSVAMFAIPASMLTWGFEAEAERMAKQSRKRALKRREAEKNSSNGRQSTCSSSSSSSDYDSDGGTTDEEYFKLISGLESPDEDETPFMKQQREKFENADADRDGTLTLKEYMKLQQESQDSPLEPGQLLQRLQLLELQVADNSTKLTRILALLEQQQQK